MKRARGAVRGAGLTRGLLNSQGIAPCIVCKTGEHVVPTGRTREGKGCWEVSNARGRATTRGKGRDLIRVATLKFPISFDAECSYGGHGVSRARRARRRR